MWRGGNRGRRRRKTDREREREKKNERSAHTVANRDYEWFITVPNGMA